MIGGYKSDRSTCAWAQGVGEGPASLVLGAPPHRPSPFPAVRLRRFPSEQVAAAASPH